MATVSATLTREKTVAIATTVDVLIMRNASGTFARLIVVMEDAMVARTAGVVVVIVIARAVRDATTLETATLIVATGNATVMRIVRHAMIVAVTKTKTAAQAQPMLTREVVWTGAATEL